MDSKRQDDGVCTPCPFSEPGKGDASNPVFQSPPGKHDPNCFTKSAEALLSSLDSTSPGAPSDITAKVCKTLADFEDGDAIFYALYYLDKTYCGLGQAHQTGDDPNVNSILTNCSHYGISNLADPGWPSSSYQCTICPSKAEQSDQTKTLSASASASTAAVTKAETTPQSSSPVSGAFPSPSLTSTSSSPASIMTPILTSPTPTSADSVSASSGDRVPSQGIAAIAVCTILATAAVLILLFFLLRRRRRQREAYSGGMSKRISRITDEYIPPGGETYEPLISPVPSISGERPPLTPPLLLRDRKLLPPLLRPLSGSGTLLFGPPIETAHHHSSSSLYSTTQSLGNTPHDAANPQSPTTPTTEAAAAAGAAGRVSSPAFSICGPASNGLEPCRERPQAHDHTSKPSISSEPPSSPPYTRLKSPPPVSFTFPPRTSLDTTSRSPPPHSRGTSKGHHRRGVARNPFSSTSTSVSMSMSGSNSSAGGGGQDYHNTIINTIPGGSSSPIRPRRPHETPLEIPDLVTPRSVSPASSPPTKMLPQPPPPIIGIARTTGLSPPATSLQEGGISLHSLAEQHRQERGSWGSWGDEDVGTGTGTGTGTWTGTGSTAGRIFGVAFPTAGGGGSGGVD